MFASMQNQAKRVETPPSLLNCGDPLSESNNSQFTCCVDPVRLLSDIQRAPARCSGNRDLSSWPDSKSRVESNGNESSRVVSSFLESNKLRHQHLIAQLSKVKLIHFNCFSISCV